MIVFWIHISYYEMIWKLFWSVISDWDDTIKLIYYDMRYHDNYRLTLGWGQVPTLGWSFLWFLILLSESLYCLNFTSFRVRYDLQLSRGLQRIRDSFVGLRNKEISEKSKSSNSRGYATFYICRMAHHPG
jgi:hypothetical protein